MLPVEYDRVYEVSETEEDFVQEHDDDKKPICYYVLNNGVVEEQHVVFERPDPGMMYHLKSLFIMVKVYDMSVNKVFIDGGASVNLMPH